MTTTGAQKTTVPYKPTENLFKEILTVKPFAKQQQ